MKKTTVRDSRYHFPEIEARLNDGEEIVIHKRQRMIARLLPGREDFHSKSGVGGKHTLKQFAPGGYEWIREVTPGGTTSENYLEIGRSRNALLTYFCFSAPFAGCGFCAAPPTAL